MTENYYNTLGINRNANQKEIKAAVRSGQLKYHPDKHIGEAAKAEATIIFNKINDASEILLDPKKKIEYDESLNSGKYNQNANSGSGNFYKSPFEDDFFKNFRTNFKFQDEKPKSNYNNGFKFQDEKPKSNYNSDSSRDGDAFKFAAQGNLERLTELLRENSNDANAKNDNVESPLSTAFHNNHANIIKELLNYGAKFSAYDFKRTDGEFSKKLINLVESKVTEIRLKDQLVLALKDVAGFWLTHEKLNQLVAENKVNLISVMLEAKKDTLVINQDMESPLSSALHRGYNDVAKILLKAGIKFSQFDFKRTDGDAARNLIKILDAKLSSELDKSQIALALKGASKVLLVHDKLSQLVAENKVNLISLIVRYNKDNRKLDLNNESPLSSALHRGHNDVAKILLKAGIRFIHFDFKRTDGDAAKVLVSKVDQICSSNEITKGQCDATFSNFELIRETSCKISYHDFCLAE